MGSTSEVEHRFVEANGIRLHFAERGEGPLVLLIHGFPESWYSWRHQLEAVADAGYRVVAPDMRGYGQTDRPAGVERYTMLHLVGDVIGLLDALGEESAVVVGHDWGAPVAWNTALLRPDRVRGVVGLSVPYAPRGPQSLLTSLRSILGEGFYMAYFQPPGVAEAELESDIPATFRKLLAAPFEPGTQPVVPEGGGLLDLSREPSSLPDWLEREDIDRYAAEYSRTGFTGGLNWYRAIDLSWELLAPWTGARVMTPALFVTGEDDLVFAMPGMKELVEGLSAFVPNLTRTLVLPGCGHWIQQERPSEVSAAIVEFERGLPGHP